MSRLSILNLVRLVSRVALAMMALGLAALTAAEDDGGYRLHDPALRSGCWRPSPARAWRRSSSIPRGGCSWAGARQCSSSSPRT